jgi:hypothetical protein
MTGLQEAFYIVGLVYMGISLLLILGVVIALGVIRKKIVSLENMVKEKIEVVTAMSERAGDVLNTVKRFTHRKSN